MQIRRTTQSSYMEVYTEYSIAKLGSTAPCFPRSRLAKSLNGYEPPVSSSSKMVQNRMLCISMLGMSILSFVSRILPLKLIIETSTSVNLTLIKIYDITAENCSTMICCKIGDLCADYFNGMEWGKLIKS